VSGVNPAACIPFTNIRIISNSGVARLKESFSGKCNHDSPTTGMTSGGCLPSVVRLQGVYDSYPLNYWRVKFQEDGLEDSQIDEKLNEKMEENNTWYGIVDGAHRHRALVELMAEDAIKWGGFTWTVMIIKPAPKSQLRAFARNVNEKQKQQYVISPTWYDTLRSFKDEYNELKALNGGRGPSASDVAATVAGGSKWASSTNVQMARVSARLSEEVVEEIGTIVNSEHPELAYRLQQRLPHISVMKELRIFVCTGKYSHHPPSSRLLPS